ncbi:MAG: DNA repair protein RecO [Clostridia bacterium]|nr:DNA repair protein RecO [Clostridia bacterium]
MIQTENTAIVLRHADYRDNDRMVTLLSPTRGRIDAIIRNCRKPKSHNLNAGELFALGDYMLYEANGRITVTSVSLIETFYPLRADYERLSCGVYLLNLAEAVAEPGQERRELFMLLLHTLSRLAFSDQETKPLLAGFLLHFASCEGFRPRLNHCVNCGRTVPENGPFFFDAESGGLCCADCRRDRLPVTLSKEQLAWMRYALENGSASWVNTPEMNAPYALLRNYVEGKLGRRFKALKHAGG